MRKVLIALLVIGSLLAVAAQTEKQYGADRFDVAISAQPDGSLSVEETVTFRFQGGPFSYVFRELPTDHTDGIIEIVAGANGDIWPQGSGPGQVEITGQNPIEIIWHLSPTSDTVETFNLAYKALGVVRQGEAADELRWQALPDEYDYAIASSRVTVDYPTAATLQGEPRVLAGKADIAAAEGVVTFTQGNLSPGDPLVVSLNFTPDSFTGAPPVWQTQAVSQHEHAWIWLAVSALTLIGGIVAVFAAARPYRNKARKTDSLAHKPPADLPPALAGYLFNQTVGWQHGLATLFDLAGRGYIRIEEAVEKKWYRSADFLVSLVSRPVESVTHEQALLDVIFTDKSGTQLDAISLSDMGRLITSSRWKGYTNQVKEEARLHGWLSDAAEGRSKRLIALGVIIMLTAVPIGAIAFLLWNSFGYWPLSLAFATFIVGMFAIIMGSTISPLSEDGAQMATLFDPFRNFIKEVSKGKLDVPDPTYYEAYLPYATAFGYAEPWVKHQSKSGYQIAPAYFKALNSADGGDMVVFLAAVTAASHSGGAAGASAAGAAGAGAAGGGASGAG